ncbi:MAG: TonB-dependent receptor plug domain-containing protein [Flavobacteriia bacterium]|nr:TonB-dependent receptor plug domain-containing protein [Flavobacteriia bacterium]
MKKSFIYLYFLSSSFLAQEKEQDLQEVKVSKHFIQFLDKNPFYVLNQNKIELGSFNDLGELLSRLPGMNIKDYGGLGGLKTISSRGINGTHIGIYIDDFAQNSVALGEMDLSKIPSNNLKEVKFIHAGQDNRLHQVSSYLNAQNIFLYTLDDEIDEKKWNFRLQNKIGSFSQREAFSSLQYKKNRWALSGFYQNRYCKGNFPFVLTNYSQKIQLKREQNEIKEQYGGLRLSYQNKKGGVFRYHSSIYDIFRELPSAVILYSNEKGQFITNQQFNQQLSYFYNSKKRRAHFLYVQHQIDKIQYTDSTFLNLEHVLRNDYLSKQFTSGIHSKVKTFAGFISFGTEYEISTLTIDTTNYQRTVWKSIMIISIPLKKWNVELLMGVLKINNRSLNLQQNGYIWTPGIQYRSKKSFPIVGEILINLKRSSRLPSFAEMYFQSVANPNLLPEIANQLSCNLNQHFQIFSKKIRLNHAFFVSSILNKIVAIPSKNLFTWTIKNYNKVLSYGSEHSLQIELFERVNHLVSLSASYTFQKNINNEKTSLLYAHQLPYMPIHSVQSGLSYQLKDFQIQARVYYLSSRYALPENILTNEVKSFYTYDLLLSYKLKIKSTQIIHFQFSILNILNYSYEFIRSYPMPGRHFTFQLSYEI